MTNNVDLTPLYEAEKKKIVNLDITPDEYEDRIARLCDELNY